MASTNVTNIALLNKHTIRIARELIIAANVSKWKWKSLRQKKHRKGREKKTQWVAKTKRKAWSAIPHRHRCPMCSWERPVCNIITTVVSYVVVCFVFMFNCCKKKYCLTWSQNYLKLITFSISVASVSPKANARNLCKIIKKKAQFESIER